MEGFAAVLSQMAAVIVAAGHGQLQSGKSKLLEKLGGKFVLQWVVEATKKVGFGHIVVVLNDAYGGEIRQALEEAGHGDVVYAHQALRLGAANAVLCAVEQVLKPKGVGNFLVAFGDMPLVRPRSMGCLAYHHMAKQAVLGFSSWEFDPEHELAQRMHNYAFVTEPWVFTYQGLPHKGSQVLSSMFTINTGWFSQVYPTLQAQDKGDGFPPEFHMPRLIECGFEDNSLMIRMAEDPRRIIGVNTAGDLELVAGLMQQLQQEGGKP